MKKKFTYLPYSGSGDFAFLACTSHDEEAAAELADILGNKGFHLSCNICSGKNSRSPEEAAKDICHCKSALIFISEKSINFLAFRNVINYILSLRKPFVCIKIGSFKLGNGLDMQLSNCKILNYTNAKDTADSLLESGILTQAMIGESMEKRSDTRRRTSIMLGISVAALLIFALSALFVISRRTSAEYILRNANGSAYVNISRLGDEGLDAMAGKTVGELDIAGGEYTNLFSISKVYAKTVNVSDLPVDIALWPLTQIEGIETVKISQNQIVYAQELCEAGIRVVITH